MKHFVILCSLLVLVASCKKESAPAAAGGGADSTETANKARFREVYDIFNSGKFDELDKYIVADFNEHTPWPGQEPGLAGLKKGFAEFKTAFPDLKITLDDVWADGDVVIGHYTQTGTMTGPLGNMPATNKKMDIHGVDIVKIKDGKATDHWSYGEEMKMSQQMGWMPSNDAMQQAPAGNKPSGGKPSGVPKSQPPAGKQKY